jgi:hypothetical protein
MQLVTAIAGVQALIQEDSFLLVAESIIIISESMISNQNRYACALCNGRKLQRMPRISNTGCSSNSRVEGADTSGIHSANLQRCRVSVEICMMEDVL